MTDSILPSLDAIQARADAATEGPWEVEEGTNAVVAPAVGHAYDGLRFRGVAEVVYTAEDRAFIAAARSDVPALVAALRAVIDLHRGGAEALGYDEAGVLDYLPACVECGDPFPCRTYTAVTAHIDTTPPKEASRD